MMLLKDLPFHWFFPHSLSWLIHVEGFSSSLGKAVEVGIVTH